MRRLFIPALAAMLAACSAPQPAQVEFNPCGEYEGQHYTVKAYAYSDGFLSQEVTSRYFAFTDCEGVDNVQSSEDTPLYLEYTTDEDPTHQHDLLFAVATLKGDSSRVDLEFKHALSYVSFVWDAREDDKPEDTYKLRRLTIWAKQVGYMRMHPGSDEPEWELELSHGDRRFVVYECSDYDAAPESRKYENPDPDQLRVAHSLYLAPGMAIAADVEYSYWRDGQYIETREAKNLILGGRENSASYILYNTHYTYTFVPDFDGIDGVKVRLDKHEWTGEVHSDAH